MAARGRQLTGTSRHAPWRRGWTIGGALVGALAFAWAFSRVDYGQLADALRQAELVWLLAVPMAIAAEQLVRAWKWRQLLFTLRTIGTLRLFGAIMAGYFANLVVPLGLSPFVRSWLVARLEALKMSAVLATVAIDRFVDGVVFAGFVAVALAFALFPDPTGGIRIGLIIGGAGSAVLFALLLLGLRHYKRLVRSPDARVLRLADRLPARMAEPARALMRSFADGIVWPADAWRGLGIVAASIVIKLIALGHFLWAGLAFGVLLRPLDYLFLLVFLGFLIILSRLARVPGGFFIGAIFALDLLGVPAEPALVMVLLVQFSTVLAVATVGAVALWRGGIALDELRHAEGASGDRA